MNKDHWTDFAFADIDSWFADLKSKVAPDLHGHLSEILLVAAARLSFVDYESRVAVFNGAQKFGAHFLPVHYYSPVPDTSAIPEETWTTKYDDIPGLELDRPSIKQLFAGFQEYGKELETVQVDGDSDVYHYSNGSFAGGDASLLYAMVRDLKPKKVIEIGSGNSTLIGLSASAKNNNGCEYICIEPYPNNTVLDLKAKGQIQLIDSSVQAVDLSLFETLTAGDILFIDSTHVVKNGSDVVYEFLKIVPRLAAGVHVHVHDIFHPLDYPREWVIDKQIFWNEQYLLAALIAYNSDFKMVVPNYAFAVEPDLKELFKSTFPFSPVQGGGSFWFKRTNYSPLLTSTTKS
jgi:predicted O-methyltransferase YrrM